LAERQSRGRKQTRIDGGVNLQVEASIGSRAERRSGSGAAAEDGEAWSNSRGWWRGSRSAASIGGRGDGWSRSGSGFNPQTGGRPEQRGTARAEADGRTAAAESADGRTASWMPAARRRIPCSPCSLPPPLSSLFPPLSLPSRAEAMRRPAREYRHAISRARLLCSFSPARARRRRVFFNLFPARATALPSVWRPPDALATPWRARRRHTNDGRGGGDTPI